MADLSNVSWDQFPARAEPADQVSPNFRFYELTKSDVALRRGINNRFASVAHARAAVNLCRRVLQPIRDQFGRYTPNSVYRCQDLERALKGKTARWVSSSQHTVGQACDVTIPGVATIELARWAAEHLEFDQIICECYDPKVPSSGWVHVSLRPPGAPANRGELLSYVMDKRTGKFAYVKGLQPAVA